MTRTIVVTGGGTGIGFGIARVFAEAGHAVWITGRRETVLRSAAERLGAHAAPFDASDPSSVEGALPRLPDAIDVLVNAAGGNTNFDVPETGTLAGTAHRWHANFAANVLSAVLTTEALSPRLQAGGTVVSFSSIGAEKASGSYGAVKAAVAAWNQSLASDLAPREITANVIAPGFIDETEFFRGRLPDTRRQSLIEATLLKRVGQVDDITGVVRFLASPAARYITAQTIHVNGGAWVTR